MIELRDFFLNGSFFTRKAGKGGVCRAYTGPVYSDRFISDLQHATLIMFVDEHLIRRKRQEDWARDLLRSL